MDNLLAFARILSDETRQEIMRMLCCQQLSVSEVVQQLAVQGKEVTQPTVSHHLAELRDANLVVARKEGRQTFYSLNQEQVTVCCGQIMTRFAPEIPLEQLRKES
jgi:ArsR family transcriptional regulator